MSIRDQWTSTVSSTTVLHLVILHINIQTAHKHATVVFLQNTINCFGTSGFASTSTNEQRLGRNPDFVRWLKIFHLYHFWYVSLICSIFGTHSFQQKFSWSRNSYKTAVLFKRIKKLSWHDVNFIRTALGFVKSEVLGNCVEKKMMALKKKPNPNP